MKRAILYSILLLVFCSLTKESKSQYIPEQAVELYQKSILTGIRADARHKDDWAIALDIRKKAEQRSKDENLSTTRNKMGSILSSIGYSQKAVDVFLENFDEQTKADLANSFSGLSDEFALTWSGTRNIFLDHRDAVKSYGNQHSNYNPRITFWQDSEFEANNSKKLDAVFRFDYLMKLKIEAGARGTYRLDLHVNSKDGSIGFEAESAKRLIGARGGDQVDFVILYKGGGGMSFTRDRRSGRLEANMLNGHPMLAGAIDGLGESDAEAKKNEEFITNWGDWIPQNMDDAHSMWRLDYTCVKGFYTHGRETVLCFAGTEKPNIKTLVPNLGFGVGIFKDYVNQVNKFIIYRESVGVFGINLKVYLEGYEEKEFSFNGASYGGKTNYDTRSTRSLIQVVQRRIAHIEAQIANENVEYDKAIKNLREEKINCRGDANCADAIATRRKTENERHRSAIRRFADRLEPLEDRIKEIRRTGQ